jgi:diguanylate cyclase (GGDEF)-like protein
MEESVRAQHARLYRIGTLGAAVGIHLVTCWMVLSIGGMSISTVGFLALVSLAASGFLLLGVAVLLEWNLALEDPGLSLPQMLWAISVVVVSAHFVTTLKPVVLLLGAALILIGANRLDRRDQVIFATFGLLLYLGSLIQLDQYSWMAEIVLLIAFALVLVFGPVLYQFEMSMMETVLLNKNRELRTALDRIKDLAVTDELTGVFNRRHLMEYLAQQKALADRRPDYRFSLCYIDLDFFKRVGHAGGDEVLKQVANIGRSILREVDCVARVGGEEFVMVLAGTAQDDAITVANRLAARLKALTVSPLEPQYRITASIGVTEYRGEDIQQTIDRADRALYQAKRTGRNKLVVANQEAPTRALTSGSIFQF